MKPGSDTLTPSFLLECDSLEFKMAGAALINTISMQLDDNGITALLGYNGAGKSLLLRLLHGMIKPTAGQILWNGRSADHALLRQQAMVFQKPVLLRRSVVANIDFVLNSRKQSNPLLRDSLLERVGLRAQQHQSARSLSGGEQQRLALARALACEPKVLFLDEATASLDPGSIRTIEEIVTEARDNGTKIIMVTHDIGQARRLADDVLFIHQGKLLEHAPAAQFLNHPINAVARAYLEGRLPISAND